MKPDFLKINNALLSFDNVLITAHVKPDGDSCGSALAILAYLKGLKKNTVIFMVDQPPAYLSFMPLIDNVTTDKNVLKKNWDVLVTLDSSDLARTGIEIADLKIPIIINIDHHISNQKFGQINCVDALASSTCEIVYKFLTAIKFPINKNIANCLLCGILGDTGDFVNSATTGEVIKISSNLVSCGAKINKIVDQVVKNKTINGLRLWGDALSRLHHDPDLKIAYTYIKETEYQKYQINEEELDGLISLLNAIPGLNVSALFRINSDHTRVSVRTTKKDVDVAEIAKRYGGGGHKNAAGFILPFPVDENSDLLSFLKNATI